MPHTFLARLLSLIGLLVLAYAVLLVLFWTKHQALWMLLMLVECTFVLALLVNRRLGGRRANWKAWVLHGAPLLLSSLVLLAYWYHYPTSPQAEMAMANGHARGIAYTVFALLLVTLFFLPFLYLQPARAR